LLGAFCGGTTTYCNGEKTGAWYIAFASLEIIVARAFINPFYSNFASRHLLPNETLQQERLSV